MRSSHKQDKRLPTALVLISSLLVSAIIVSASISYSQQSHAAKTQACIDLNSGRFELDTQSGEVEFVIEGCDGQLHRWGTVQQQEDTRL